MHIYQTDRLKEVTKGPTQLDIERILNRRSDFRPFYEKNKLKRLEAGAAGEQIVLAYLKKYGHEDWVIIRNMWLVNGGPFEADLILLTNHRPYLFEVKNYTSDFKYKDGAVSFNNQIASNDPIYQTRRNRIKLEKICQMYSNPIQVNGALILVGIDNYTEIQSEVEAIDIVKRTELRHFIEQIGEEERIYQGQPLNKKQVIKQLERFEIKQKYGPEVVSPERIKKLRKGVQCPYCDGFDVQINRKLTDCPCGFKENREIAILRTVCEYGVLTFNKPLRVGELLDFLDGAVSKGNLLKILRKYFKEVRKGRYTYYINAKLPLNKLYKKFNIQNLIELRMTYQDFDELT